jgi:hypothetical protein
MDKRFYKVISLFIKAILLIASFYYITQKLTTPDAVATFHSITFSNETSLLLVFCLILMFFNWNLEAMKWKLLIAPYEEISWLQSMQSILAGITISIFTPNRVGEFTGRIFFLKTADRLIASLKSIVGSCIQLSITLIAGMTGIWMYIKNGYNVKLPLHSLFDHQRKFLFLLALCGICMVLLAMIRWSFFTKWKHQVKEIFNIKKTVFITVFALSLTRYAIFTFQYYLLVLALGVEIELVQACMLISIIFFITALIPSFALTEIVVRSAVAVYIFSILEPAQPLLIASASLLLWLINLAIPALIGSTFIGKLQFFKTH